MCGIAGAFATTPVADSVLLMTNAIHHRGPDDVGIADLPSTAGRFGGTFGHRRLAILDLSMAGHQPMFSRDGRFCLTYNGEIYNYREIRAELDRVGVTVRSTGDTEVLLAAWQHFGGEMLGKLRGMFALAIWDSVERRGYLARDEFGIKPLYYAERNGVVLFASEIRALLASGMVPRTLSEEAVATYLATGSVSEPLSIIDGIRAVPPGCVMEVATDGTDVRVAGIRRFASPFATAEQTSTESQAVTDLRAAIRDSVSHHLISDVPLGLFLSGGLDSSSMVALASEVSETTIDTFTVTFGDSVYSEAEPAREIANRYGTRHHEILLSARDLLNALPDVFSAMDQPSLDGLNTFIVSRAVRAHGIKVVLSGLGGDELFAGYPSFRRASSLASLWRLPSNLRKLAGSAHFGDARLQKVSDVLGQKTPAFGAYLASRTLFARERVRSLTGRILADGADEQRFVEERSADLSLLQQVSYYEMTGYMRNTLLRDSDVFSMVHGLELRVPLVDREVAKAALAAPDSLKLKRGSSKPLLVEAMGDLLPQSLVQRPKQGFTLPFQDWMKGELFGEVDSVLGSSRPDRVGLGRAGVGSVWSDFQRGRAGVNWSRPWALYTLLRWAEQNDVRAPGPQAALKQIR